EAAVNAARKHDGPRLNRFQFIEGFFGKRHCRLPGGLNGVEGVDVLRHLSLAVKIQIRMPAVLYDRDYPNISPTGPAFCDLVEVILSYIGHSSAAPVCLVGRGFKHRSVK